MKRMCLVMLAALAIIICVIAVQNFRESKDEVYDGILIEKIQDEYKLIDLSSGTNGQNGGI